MFMSVGGISRRLDIHVLNLGVVGGVGVGQPQIEVGACGSYVLDLTQLLDNSHLTGIYRVEAGGHHNQQQRHNKSQNCGDSAGCLFSLFEIPKSHQQANGAYKNYESADYYTNHHN